MSNLLINRNEIALQGRCDALGKSCDANTNVMVKKFKYK